jgi:hypothetical protein
VRLFFAFALILLPVEVLASTPQGKEIGPWRVIWITSMSGVDGDDASAMIVQEVNKPSIGDGDLIEANWFQNSVTLNLRIQNCRGEDEDFDRSLRMATEGWLKQSDDVAATVLGGVIRGWLNEARAECSARSVRRIFRLDRLQEASRLFDYWVGYFAPSVMDALAVEKR